MKILITCYYLDLSGSSTYTQTLACQLKKRGNIVEVFTLFPGEIAKELGALGIFVIDKIETLKTRRYDVIIAQHSVLAILARNYHPDIPMVYISHGVIPFLERPPQTDLNIQKYIAVSEETRSNIVDTCSIPPEHIDIIPNMIDTEKFDCIRPINPRPNTLLFLTNHQHAEALANVQAACRKLGLRYQRIGGPNKTLLTRDAINRADIVVSIGRGALEAMSCGRPVIVYDLHGGDGMITEDNWSESAKCNFSGRRFGKKLSADDLIYEIKKYNPGMSDKNRKIAFKNFSAHTIIGIFEDFLSHAVDSFRYRPIKPEKNIEFLCNQLVVVRENLRPPENISKKILKKFNISKFRKK